MYLTEYHWNVKKSSIHFHFGKTLQHDERRFFITKVLRNAAKWKDFDCDTIDKRAAILWNKNDIKRISTHIGQVTGAEATNPTPLASRRRKGIQRNGRIAWERKQLTLASNTLMKLRKGMVKCRQKKLKKESWNYHALKSAG